MIWGFLRPLVWCEYCWGCGDSGGFRDGDGYSDGYGDGDGDGDGRGYSYGFYNGDGRGNGAYDGNDIY